jgi:hypothetical protein
MCPICRNSFNQRSNLKSHLLTHNDIKPKQLLEMAERMEMSGRRPTCAGKASSAPATTSPVRHRLEDDEDEDEDIADIDVCSDEDQLIAMPATFQESYHRWESELAASRQSGRGGEDLLRAEELLRQGDRVPLRGGTEFEQEHGLHTKAECKPFGFSIAELMRK